MGIQQTKPCSVLATGETPGPFAIRRHPNFPGEVMKNPEGLKTMQDMYLNSLRKFKKNPYLGYRPKQGETFLREYVWQTYEEADVIVRNFGQGLWSLGVQHKSFLGVYSDNSFEWVYAIDASSLFGFCIVALYDTLGEKAASFIIDHSEIEVVMVSETRFSKLIGLLQANKFKVHTVIVMDSKVRPESAAQLESIGVRVFLFSDVVKIGSEKAIDLPKIDEEDLNFICYSSGTTGDPKGVMVNQRTNVSNLLAACYIIQMPPNGGLLSYLPLAHVMERATHGLIRYYGSKYGFTSNGVRSLVDDLQVLKPTLLTMVPRVANRFFETVQQKIKKSSSIQRGIFWTCYHIKQFCLARGLPTFPLDLLVFNKIKDNMGGNVTEIICGSAATAPDVHQFLKICLGIPFRCGYGLTEAGSGNICQLCSVNDCVSGTVGGPLPNCEVRIDPHPDYSETEGAGELLLGGPCVSSGYLKNPEATNQLFVDPDHHWIRTGDVAKWDEKGHLMIVDRLRSIFKLSQGEYVAADVLTSIFESTPIAHQIFLYGDSSRTFLVAIVVPVRSEVANFLGKASFTDAEYVEACQSEDLRKYVLEQCNKTAKEKNVLGFALLKTLRIEPNEWTIDNDILTPTFKYKRKALLEKYRAQIDEMYNEFGQF